MFILTAKHNEMRLSRKDSDKRFAEFIFFIKDYQKLNRKDLEYCMNHYMNNEEYEKCVTLRDFLNSKKTDNRRIKYLDFYEFMMGCWENVDNLIEKYDFISDDERQQKLIRFQEENEERYWSLLENIKIKTELKE